jgi:hypothetical protein
MPAHEKMPENWQEVVFVGMRQAVTNDPTRAIHGLSLPESWKSELTPFVRNGEVGRLFGVKAVTFSGKEVRALYKPPEEGKEEPRKSTKKGG